MKAEKLENKFVLPDSFDLPQLLVLDNWLLQPLDPSIVELDYEAVMSSRIRLRQVFSADDIWPADNMTLEENLRDLQWHDLEFQQRSSFAYTVLSLDRSRCLGCCYIYYSSKVDFDLDLYFWLRESESRLNLETEFGEKLKAWILEKWPVERVALPGREISWNDWDKLASSGRSRPSPAN